MIAPGNLYWDSTNNCFVPAVAVGTMKCVGKEVQEHGVKFLWFDKRWDNCWRNWEIDRLDRFLANGRFQIIYES